MTRILLTLAILLCGVQAQDVYATFNVEAKKSANLAFISTGIVKKVNVEIGSVVQENDVLAELKNRDTKAMLDVANTTFKYAKKDLGRQQKVKKLIDEGKFDAVSNRYESAKDSLVYQKVLYDRTFLKAPFDGIIYGKELEVGDAVSGQALRTVLKIQSIVDRKIVLSFDQKYHKVVKVGEKFKYRLDGDTNEYVGTISKVHPYANPETRKIRAEVIAKDLMVGLFGDGYILIDNNNSSKE